MMGKRQERGKLIILSAPSGAGKTSIVKVLMKRNLKLKFSVSATTRAPREGEQHGIDYFFLEVPAFKRSVEQGDFIEYEEVYEGCYYGTLKSEVEKILDQGYHALFDIDVMGGINIKKQFRDQALAVFIMPPDIATLERRLAGRGSETKESLVKRLEKARWELSFAPGFDVVIVNNQLEQAVEEVATIIREFTGQ
jgi:guanylate kinase